MLHMISIIETASHAYFSSYFSVAYTHRARQTHTIRKEQRSGIACGRVQKCASGVHGQATTDRQLHDN